MENPKQLTSRPSSVLPFVKASGQELPGPSLTEYTRYPFLFYQASPLTTFTLGGSRKGTELKKGVGRGLEGLCCTCKLLPHAGLVPTHTESQWVRFTTQIAVASHSAVRSTVNPALRERLNCATFVSFILADMSVGMVRANTPQLAS